MPLPSASDDDEESADDMGLNHGASSLPLANGFGGIQQLVAHSLEAAERGLAKHHERVLDLLGAHLNGSCEQGTRVLELSQDKLGLRAVASAPGMPPKAKLLNGAMGHEALELPGSISDNGIDAQERTDVQVMQVMNEIVAPEPRVWAGRPPGSPSNLNFGDLEDVPMSKKLGSMDDFSTTLRSAQESIGLASTSISCRYCGNIFMADSEFCRKCGNSRLSMSGTDNMNPRQEIHFKVLPVWEPSQHHHLEHHGRDMMNRLHNKGKDSVHRNVSKASHASGSTRGSSGSRLGSRASLDTVSLPDDNIPWYIVHPYSGKRGLWDVWSLVLVLYDAVMIPLDFFQPPESTFKEFCDWVARLFWTCDVVASSFTGYVTADGGIAMEHREILVRYLKSWFCLDILVVGVDWAEVFARSAAAGYARLGKVTRTFRIVRMVRLLRIARMKEVLALITERFSSQKILVVMDISKLMAVILGMAHLIACVWFGIAWPGGNPSESWVYKYEFDKKDFGARYAMSLHWAISQFAGGMDEITPENPRERVYAMVVLLIAFIVASFFISSLTSSMTELQILGSTEAQKAAVLRGYLHQNKISSKLAMRVQRNAQHCMKEQQRHMPEESVELLRIVSEPLTMELHFEIYRPMLSIHPFFNRYVVECPQVMRRVCDSAAKVINVSAGDHIFSTGEIPAHPKMRMVCNGTLQYTAISKRKIEVKSGDWISEASLWTLWMYRGDLVAMSNCRLCLLDSNKFQDIAGQFHHHDFDPKVYAALFVQRLCTCVAQSEDFNDLTDFSHAVRAEENLGHLGSNTRNLKDLLQRMPTLGVRPSTSPLRPSQSDEPETVTA